MGATGWSYFTPYDADVEKALQTLRKQVFEGGKFGQANQVLSQESSESMPPEARKAFERLRELESKRLGSGPGEFDSIEELLESAAESGTHTILDILSTSTEPEFAATWPADEDAILEVFGTLTPTHEQVQEKQGELTEELDRWQAVYLTVFKDGKPWKLYFEGVSGD
jgi:hypothetical protein